MPLKQRAQRNSHAKETSGTGPARHPGLGAELSHYQAGPACHRPVRADRHALYPRRLAAGVVHPAPQRQVPLCGRLRHYFRVGHVGRDQLWHSGWREPGNRLVADSVQRVFYAGLGLPVVQGKNPPRTMARRRHGIDRAGGHHLCPRRRACGSWGCVDRVQCVGLECRQRHHQGIGREGNFLVHGLGQPVSTNPTVADGLVDARQRGVRRPADPPRPDRRVVPAVSGLPGHALRLLGLEYAAQDIPRVDGGAAVVIDPGVRDHQFNADTRRAHFPSQWAFHQHHYHRPGGRALPQTGGA